MSETDNPGGRTRAEHLEWCKQRALEYVEIGEVDNAFMSMCSDLSKHPDTKMSSATAALAIALMAHGDLDAADAMRHWINGFT